MQTLLSTLPDLQGLLSVPAIMLASAVSVAAVIGIPRALFHAIRRMIRRLS